MSRGQTFEFVRPLLGITRRGTPNPRRQHTLILCDHLASMRELVSFERGNVSVIGCMPEPIPDGGDSPANQGFDHWTAIMRFSMNRPTMINFGPVSECLPIGAFLAAEIDSSRWGEILEGLLLSFGRTRALVDSPDYRDADENRHRRAILSAYRGYPDVLLFRGFPHDATWFRVALQPVDFDSMRYANVPMTQQLSGGTLLVKDGARNLTLMSRLPEGAEHIPCVLAELQKGHSFPPLLAVEGPGVPLTLLEGHSRATAYVIDAKTTDVEAYVARSPFMGKWAFG